MVRIGIDIGGTFTDIVVAGDDEVRTHKVPSTPADPSRGAIDAVEAAAVDPAAVEEFDHGTTVATNIAIERNPGARVVFLTDEGFADVLEIMRTDRENMYDRQWEKPDPLVPRTDRHGVPARTTVDGEIHTPLDEAAVRAVVREYADRDETVSYAVSMLHSYANATHERRVAEIIAEEHPEAYVSSSHDVFPQAGEYERASTVVANAYVKPKMRDYVERLAGDLRERGMDAPVNIMQSNGGLLPVSEVADVPAKTLFSGPAAGIAGATHFGGDPDLITMDMGGTSTDVGLVQDGVPVSTTEGEIQWGIPVQFPQMDIEAVGAGGGSIAWVDEGGLLKVGPQSAGADPGPVCYGRGGTEPTVTDANIVLGRLNPETFAGDLDLDVAAARAAVADLGERLGMDAEETALGILEIAMNALTGAIRSVTVERGVDPREFGLVAFGGAGPMHAPGVIKVSDIPRAIVPPNPGVLSAAGLLTTDFRYDQLQSFIRPLSAFDDDALDDLNDEVDAMVTEGQAALDTDGLDTVTVELAADLRYREQAYEVTVPLASERPVTSDDLAAAAGRFHEKHEQLYGHKSEGDAVEVVNVHVAIVGTRTPPGALDPEARGGGGTAEEARVDTREAVFADGRQETAIYARDLLAPGSEFTGPAIVEEGQSTTVVLPGQRARVDPTGNLVIEETGGEDA
ncbi:MAG: hydantoinase/oxoprolinase family protein [Haloarculaceae archaeon]